MKRMIVLLLVAFSAMLWGSTMAAAEEPIYIALSAPITGNYAEYGGNFKKSIDLAIEWINEAGGINGRPLELIVGDSKGLPKESATLAQKFVSDKRIVAEIGDFTSTSCLAAQPIYKKAGMVQLSPTSSHPDFAPGSPYSFGIVGTQTGEGPFMARMAANTLGRKKLAVLYINNDWGIISQKLFVEEAERLGAEITAIESYFDGTTDFTAVLTKLRASNPELLYICSMYNDGAMISKQRQKLGWNEVAMMGPGSLYSPQLIELGEDAVENIYTSCVFFPKDPRPEVQKYVKGYEEKYNQTPNMFAALAYDAINLLAETIKKAGTDREAIRAELAKTKDFPGVTGKITFTENGDVVKEYREMYVKDGEFQLYTDK